MKYLLNTFLKASVENPFFQGFTITQNIFPNERLTILRDRAEFYRCEIEKLQKHIDSNYGGTRWIGASAHVDAADMSGNPALYKLCREIEKLAAKKAQVEQEIAKIERKEKRKQYEIAKAERKEKGEETLSDKIDNVGVFLKVWSGRIFVLFVILLVVRTCIAQPQTRREREYETSKISSNVLVSEDGNLKIRQLRSYQDACATGQPSDSYYVQNGVSGVLYPSQCSKYGSDVAEYKFVDTGGNERCTGKAVLSYAGGYVNGRRDNRIVTVWEIQNAVSGYNCNTIGETYEIIMRSAQ